MRYIFFYIFIYIFLCKLKKSFFQQKKKISIKLFFHIKKFFSTRNVYFVKNTNLFYKKKIDLVLQQMNNHNHQAIDGLFNMNLEIYLNTFIIYTLNTSLSFVYEIESNLSSTRLLSQKKKDLAFMLKSQEQGFTNKDSFS